MINENKVTEIIFQITVFSKGTYTKSKFLPELLKLQKELIDLTINAENGDLRLWDVERNLRKMNDVRGHVANDELAKSLQGNDGIVFTNKAIFIIEVKNSKKSIFIDEHNEFYKIRNSMHYDCNNANKMDEREAFPRKALERTVMDHLKIFKIITFTNLCIDVECKHHYIKICPSNYFSSFIERFTSNQWYFYEDICTVMEAVTEVKCSEEYQMTIYITDFKRDFAILMTKLETAEEVDNEPKIVQEENKEPKKNIDTKPDNKNTIVRKYGSMITAAVVVTLINVVFISISRLIRR